MAAVREAGLAGELAAGITGAKTGIRGPLSGRMRFPDELGAILKEVKNVKYQGLTSQIRDYIEIAKNARGGAGIPFELWVRESTILSKPLQRARDAGEVIIKFLPGL